MDLAHTLIRSVARAFYDAEYILILDAILLHSALRDDDLATVMGSQTKHTRKLCSRLLEDGMLHKASRPEMRQGASRAVNRDYYYVNLHLAIDSVKWRLASMSRRIAARYGQSEDERKDYLCTQCKSEFTQMEVLDTSDFNGNFICKRCGHVLRMLQADEKQSAGHEIHSRLNAQMLPFEDLMRRIDSTDIPENDFEYALTHRKEIRRDDVEHRVKFEAVPSKYAPAAVHGLKIEQEELQVDVHDHKQTQELEAAQKAERARKLAAQNALPSWHTQSTVTGDVTEIGRKEQEQRDIRDRDLGGYAGPEDSKDRKVQTGSVEESDQFKQYMAAMQESQAQEADEEGTSSGEEESDDEEFEDVALEEQPLAKKAKLETVTGGDASLNAIDTPGTSRPSSSSTPVPVETNGTHPEEANGTNGEADSDEDELDFQDV